MKGVIFTQFLRFAEDQFGPDTAALLANDARYSPSGDYDHSELQELARRLGEATANPPAELLRRFGIVLFHYFAAMYPVFFAGVDTALGFLSRTETYIHGELIKLYPDAQFPRFDVRQPSANQLEMVYRSRRELADLAEGLIAGCAEHFGESIAVRRENLRGNGEQAVRFTVSTAPAAVPLA